MIKIRKNSGMIGNILLGFFLMNISCAKASELRIAVASNFILPFKELSREFQGFTGKKILLISGSTGKLFAQIIHGAPFDIFLAADSFRPKLLEKEGLGVPGTRFTYALGRLVLWSLNSKFLFKNDLQVLSQKNFRYLAIANPKTAPYGKAAEQVLRKKGLWKKIQNRLVRGENISQTFQFVITGNADMGFIAYSQFIRKQSQLRGYSLTIPKDWHNPIRQQAILLKRAKANKLAFDFISFLKNKRTKKIIESYGYSHEY